jgi:sulfur-oxidizing protein SoxY
LLRIGACLALFWSASAPVPGLAAERATAEQPSDSWAFIKDELFGDRPMQDGSGMIALDAPYRAEDAAIVPIGLSVDPGPERRVARLTLVIDENPVPVAAAFELGEGMGRPVELSMRVRVNAYSNVRAIAELDDGSLHQFARFVKASGGCSAPAGKDPAEAAAGIGRMKLALEQAAALDQPQVVQLMIRHPNHSGLAMDQITRLYTPPHYVKQIDIAYNGKRIMRAETDISISENPNFRFYFVPRQEGTLTVEAVDSRDVSYRTSLAVRQN